MRYVVDIDGTICTSTPDHDYKKSVPIQKRIDAMNKLYDEGNTVVYFTARGMGRFEGDSSKAIETFYEITKNQLDFWGVKYHALILGKPFGDVYVDDRGVNAEDFFFREGVE
jgi:histidinol phosphatase-like enzyme